MTAPNDMANLADVKTFLNETTSNNDAVLSSLITVVSTLIQDFTDNPILAATYDWVFSGWGSKTAVPPYGPATINFINIDGTSIPLVSPTTNPYPRYGYTFDPMRQEVRLAGCHFTRGEANCEINYTAGYANIAAIPMDLQYAVWALVGWLFRNRNRQGKSSESVGGRMTAAYLATWAPLDVTLIIEHYTRRNVG